MIKSNYLNKKNHFQNISIKDLSFSFAFYFSLVYSFIGTILPFEARICSKTASSVILSTFHKDLKFVSYLSYIDFTFLESF